MKKLFFSAVLMLLGSFAHSENNLLPADDAFSFQASVVDENILLEWNIADGYYLYKEK